MADGDNLNSVSRNRRMLPFENERGIGGGPNGVSTFHGSSEVMERESL